MPNCCAVPGCTKPNGFRFPSDKSRRQQWFVAIKRDKWIPKSHSVVCADHFLPSDFKEMDFTTDGLPRSRNRLKPTAVPSVFPWTAPESESSRNRASRKCKRSALKDNTKPVELKDDITFHFFSEHGCEDAVSVVSQNLDECESEIVNVIDQSCCVAHDTVDLHQCNSNESLSFLNSSETIDLTVENEEVVENQETHESDDDVEFLPPNYKDNANVIAHELLKQTKRSTSSTMSLINEDIFCLPYVCIERLEKSDNLIHHYTGLETYSKFLTAFDSLGPNVDKLNYVYTNTSSLSPKNCFLLMLVKLRCNYPVEELARMLSLSPFSINNTFYTWIIFCARQWEEVNIWPSRELVNYHCPFDFKNKFPKTCVIVDGTEIPIKKPSNPSSQRATFSSYKHKNTVKVLVGATPGGLVSFVSEVYGGSASDRQIVERSNLLTLCEPNDSIMADKGFNVQDIFAPRDVSVNMPTFKKKKIEWTRKQLQKIVRFQAKGCTLKEL